MIFITSFINEPNGAAKSAIDFLKSLLVINENVSVICPKEADLPHEVAGFKINKPHWYKPPTRFKLGIQVLVPGSIIQKRAIKEIIHRIKCLRLDYDDTVIVNSWASKKNWQIINQKFRGKKILIVRESVRNFGRNEFGITKENLSNFLSEFDSLIFVSSIVMQDWANILQKDASDFFYLPNCIEEELVQKIELEEKSEVRIKLNLQPEDFILIYPARIEYNKGQDILLDHYNEIMKINPKIKILILGMPFGTDGEVIASRMKEYQNFIVLPEQASALDYIFASDLLIFPSRAEAMPRTILEAMAFGIPVLASNVDGIPELIKDGFNGFLFDIENPETLVEKLSTMINNYKMLEDFSKNSKEKYYRDFSRAKHIKRLGDILEKI
jgi:glycosyltransferase involved in cell wall biosynthesis